MAKPLLTDEERRRFRPIPVPAGFDDPNRLYRYIERRWESFVARAHEADPYGEAMDPLPSKDDLSHRLLSELVAEVRAICEGGYADVYRALRLSPLHNRVYVDRLGLYWSWSERTESVWCFGLGDGLATVEVGDKQYPARARFCNVLLEGRVAAQDIDWDNMPLVRVFYDDEGEIPLKSDVAVELLSINGVPFDPPVWGNSGPTEWGDKWRKNPGRVLGGWRRSSW